MTATIAAVTQSQSLAAIRNFVRASISCITYTRGLCSDGSYESRPFLGMELKHMVPTSTEAITISEWIEKGAFDALNKHYLREMALCIHNADCTEQLESYSFSFTYSADGERACMTVNSSGPSQQSQVVAAARTPNQQRCTREEVQQALTAILVRLREIVETLPPLVSERVVTMRLTYYDEVTPETYQPPCFASASERMVRFYREEQKSSVRVGAMGTGHHSFTVAVHHPLLARVREGLPSGAPPLGPESGLTGTATPISATTPTPTSIAPTPASTGAAHGGRRTAAAQPVPAADPVPSAARTNPTAALWASEATPAPSLLALATHPGPLRPCEVSFLLLACFVLVRCAPSSPAGRGRLTLAELQDHLRESCALDMAATTAGAVMEQLMRDGYLRRSEVGAVGGRARKTARTSRTVDTTGAWRGDAVGGAAAEGSDEGEEHDPTPGAALGGEAALAEWCMPSDPPRAVLAALLKRRQVTDLLAPADHVALTKLYAAVERASVEEAQQRGPGKRESRHRGPRMSCADSRKRRKDGQPINT